MRIRGILVASFGLALMASTALAAELGRVELNGAQIIINDDNSWEYVDGAAAAVGAPAGCTEIKSDVVPVSLCLDGGKWGNATLDGAHEHAFKVKDREIYVLMITEKEVLKVRDFRNAIITNAQNAAGLNKVNVIEESTASIDKTPFNKISYSTIIDGTDIAYTNYYGPITGAGSVQIVSFCATPEFEAMAPFVAEVIAGMKVSN